MGDKLKVLVLGTGFAGQGHAEAFRAASTEVVGIVGRTKKVVQEVAQKKGIPYAGINWSEALQKCKPDIVSIATPGGAHFEPIMQAMDFGCHVFCDKPLAENGELARKLYEKSLAKGIKTAFAASYRYMPAIIYAKKLIADGIIGEPREAESISHFNLDPNIPFGWSHRIDQGGGRLNNNFTHLLSIMTYCLGEKILAVCGEVRNDMPKAPVVEGVHNFAERRNFIPENINDPGIAWKKVDAEWSYTAMVKLESDYPSANPVSILFKHGGLVPRFTDDHIVFYGSKASIFIKGHYGKGPLYLCRNREVWEEMTIPEEIFSNLPNIEDDTQRNWTHLACEFVKDLEGKTVEPYQTFKDGSVIQQIIDLLRRNDRWVDVRSL